MSQIAERRFFTEFDVESCTVKELISRMQSNRPNTLHTQV